MTGARDAAARRRPGATRSRSSERTRTRTSATTRSTTRRPRRTAGLAGSAGSYAVGLTSIGLYNFFTSNYNDLYSSGASSHFASVGVIGSSTAAQVPLFDRTSFAAWRAETGTDASSISADPLYTSATDLRPLGGSPLLGAGQPVGGITTDIVGDPRGNPPTIGALREHCRRPASRRRRLRHHRRLHRLRRLRLRHHRSARAARSRSTTLSPATPYPSTCVVSGVTGTVSDVNVNLNGMSHTYPDDVDMLLVSPDGQNAIFMSDAGGGTAIVSCNLTIDDEAATALPDSTRAGLPGELPAGELRGRRPVRGSGAGSERKRCPVDVRRKHGERHLVAVHRRRRRRRHGNDHELVAERDGRRASASTATSAATATAAAAASTASAATSTAAATSSSATSAARPLRGLDAERPDLPGEQRRHRQSLRRLHDADLAPVPGVRLRDAVHVGLRGLGRDAAVRVADEPLLEHLPAERVAGADDVPVLGRPVHQQRRVRHLHVDDRLGSQPGLPHRVAGAVLPGQWNGQLRVLLQRERPGSEGDLRHAHERQHVVDARACRTARRAPSTSTDATGPVARSTRAPQSSTRRPADRLRRLRRLRHLRRRLHRRRLRAGRRSHHCRTTCSVRRRPPTARTCTPSAATRSRAWRRWTRSIATTRPRTRGRRWRRCRRGRSWPPPSTTRRRTRSTSSAVCSATSRSCWTRRRSTTSDRTRGRRVRRCRRRGTRWRAASIRSTERST